jgi:ribosome-interacting GTPase 1
VSTKIHHDVEFDKLRKRFGSTGTQDERIALLKELVALSPRNPKSRGLKAQYRAELEKLQEQRKGSRGHGGQQVGYDAIHFARQVALVGQTNTGKSTLLSVLSGHAYQVSPQAFTTFKPEVGTAHCEGVPVQIVEVPAVYPGDAEPDKFRFLRNVDVLCICAATAEDVEIAAGCLEDAFVVPVGDYVTPEKHKQRPKDEIIEKPAFVAGWDANCAARDLEVVPIDDPAGVGAYIRALLHVKRVYSSRKGEIDAHPRVFPLDREVTVEDFATAVDRRLLKTYHRARITGPSAGHAGQMVGLGHVLADGDIVELVR